MAGEWWKPRVTRADIVVLSILLVLAAILLAPLFFMRREWPSSDHCLSNLRQLAMELIIYADDHNERYPAVSMNAKEPWTSNVKIDRWLTRCPSNHGIIPSYGFNGLLSGKQGFFTESERHTPLVTDLSPNAASAKDGRNYAVYDWNKDIDPRHEGKVNIAFIDGSVVSLPMPSGVPYLETLYRNGYDPLSMTGRDTFSHMRDGTLNAAAQHFTEKKAVKLGRAYGWNFLVSAKDWSSASRVSAVASRGAELADGTNSFSCGIIGGRQAFANVFGQKLFVDFAPPLKNGEFYEIRSQVIQGKLTNKHPMLYLTVWSSDKVIGFASMPVASGSQIVTHCGLVAEPSSPAMDVAYRQVRLQVFDIP